MNGESALVGDVWHIKLEMEGWMTSTVKPVGIASIARLLLASC